MIYMNKKWLWLLVFIPFLLAASALLALGPAPYPTGPVTFSTYAPEPGVVVPGERFRYQFSWNGIKAAEAVWETRPAPNRPGWLWSRADAKIIGYPATLYRGQDYVASCLRADTFKPEAYSIQIRESLDSYDMTVKFNHPASIANRTKISRTKQTSKSFEFSNVYDPVGLALLIRSLPWKTGDERRFEVIDGNSRYLFVINGGQVDNVTVPAGTFRAIRLIPSIFELPGQRRSETARHFAKQKRKEESRSADMTSFTFWMALDPPRPYLKVRTDVFFGHVDMDLVEISRPPTPK
jgi:hypothetical protein